MVTMRMFIALPLPDAVNEHLADYLEPRQEAGPELRWTVPEQWHLTLAFLPEVAERHEDELLERLARAARRRQPLQQPSGWRWPLPLPRLRSPARS